jgi:hypothetical protein
MAITAASAEWTSTASRTPPLSAHQREALCVNSWGGVSGSSSVPA